MNNLNKLSAKERLDYVYLTLSEADHDCDGQDCSTCAFKYELEQEIKEANNQASLAQATPTWEFDETELAE